MDLRDASRLSSWQPMASRDGGALIMARPGDAQRTAHHSDRLYRTLLSTMLIC